MNVPCKIPDIVKAYESIAISIFIEPKVLQDHQIKSLLVDISEPLRKMITLASTLEKCGGVINQNGLSR